MAETPPSGANRSETIARLRTEIARIEAANSTKPEAAGTPAPGPLTFGIAAIDEHLPGGGLATGAMHEIISGDESMAATGFALALAARLPAMPRRCWLWCSRTVSLYGPGLAAFGLIPESGLVLHLDSEKEILQAMEESLSCPTLAAVFGELRTLDVGAGRRLALAAREGSVTAFLLRGCGAEGRPSMAASRWRVKSLPSSPFSLPAPIGKGREALQDGYAWQVDLLRSRGAMPRSWRVLWRPDSAFSKFSPPADHAQDDDKNENGETFRPPDALSLASPFFSGAASRGTVFPWHEAV